MLALATMALEYQQWLHIQNLTMGRLHIRVNAIFLSLNKLM
jgi:hypothetical protein